METEKPPRGPKDLADRKAWVLHVETKTIGRAVRYYEVGEAVSPLNEEKVEAPVLELDTGDTFLAKPDAFVPLTLVEQVVYLGLVDGFASVVRLMAHPVAALSGIPQEDYLMLARSALSMQERKLWPDPSGPETKPQGEALA